jgi:hypothetical protein
MFTSSTSWLCDNVNATGLPREVHTSVLAKGWRMKLSALSYAGHEPGSDTVDSLLIKITKHK